MSGSFTYRTIIEPDTKGYHGYVPALKGCHTWGKTILETKAHLQEAIAVYLESLVAHNVAIPLDESFESYAVVQLPQLKLKSKHKLQRAYAS